MTTSYDDLADWLEEGLRKQAFNPLFRAGPLGYAVCGQPKYIPGLSEREVGIGNNGTEMMSIVLDIPFELAEQIHLLWKQGVSCNEIARRLREREL